MSAGDFQISQPQPDTLAVSGALDFSSAGDVLARARPVLEGGAVRVLDLSGVKRADSAGLACVLSLLAAAERNGARPRIHGMPSSLERLASVSDAEALLG